MYYNSICICIVVFVDVCCKIGASCAAIFLYADDIILLSPSVFALQTLVNVCALELQYLDVAVNAGKSACMRFGPRSKSAVQILSWVGHRSIG